LAGGIVRPARHSVLDQEEYRMGFDSDAILKWLLTTGVRIGAIVLGAVIVLAIVRVIIARARRRLGPPEKVGVERAKRTDTLAKLIENIIRVVVSVGAVIMILDHVGIEVGPLLAGAGIVGLALSFGAQSLVKDLINGFFILLENNINVGDVAEIAGVAGVVEKVGLRVTLLRDLEGKLHAVPNGEIKTISNLTKEWSRAVLDIGVSYRENVDRVIEVLRSIGDGLRSDETIGPLILEPMEILGVDNLGDSAVTIKVMFKTQPIKQWQVAREFRRRVKRTFDEKGIQIPFPQRTISFEGAAGGAPPRIDVANPSGS
jgi:small-conductance mechanosensitive channel